jgi:hypothetical protein
VFLIVNIFAEFMKKHKLDKRAYTMSFGGGYNENSGEKSEMGRKMDEAMEKLWRDANFSNHMKPENGK